MWSCNSSASPAVLPERRVLLIVTLWAAADEIDRTFSAGSAAVAARSRLSR